MSKGAKFRTSVNLYDATRQSDLKVLLISGDYDIRHSLNELGIHPGDRIRVLRRAPFGGPLLIETRGAQVAIGRQLAERIRVEVLQ